MERRQIEDYAIKIVRSVMTYPMSKPDLPTEYVKEVRRLLVEEDILRYRHLADSPYRDAIIKRAQELVERQ